jgi:hypothetical protein
LRKTGYDESLYSIKSRVIITSLHSDTPLQTIIQECLSGSMMKRAWDLYMHHQFTNRADMQIIKKNRDYIFFRVTHQKCYGCSYGLANHSEDYLRAEIDMTDSEN